MKRTLEQIQAFSRVYQIPRDLKIIPIDDFDNVYLIDLRIQKNIGNHEAWGIKKKWKHQNKNKYLYQIEPIDNEKESVIKKELDGVIYSGLFFLISNTDIELMSDIDLKNFIINNLITPKYLFDYNKKIGGYETGGEKRGLCEIIDNMGCIMEAFEIKSLGEFK